MVYFQVETVGQTYMAASGAPLRTKSHATNIADLALCMTKNVLDLKVPNRDILIRIGYFIVISISKYH